MDTVDRMRLAAGLPIRSNQRVTTIIKESAGHGEIHSFWVTLDPETPHSTVIDCMMEIKDLRELINWAAGLKMSTKDPERIHEIISSARFFHDRASAQDDAKERILKKTTDHYDEVIDAHTADDTSATDIRTAPSVVKHKPKSEKAAVRAAIAAAEDEEQIAYDERNEEIAPSQGSEEEDRIEAFGEALDYVDDNFPITWADNNEKPVNVADTKPLDMYKTPEKPEVESSRKIAVPAEIKTALKDVIAELTKEFQKAILHDKSAAGYYPSAIELMVRLLDLMNSGDVEDIRKAQLELQGMCSHFLHRVPDSVVKFIANGGKKRSLKSLFQEIKQ